MMMMMLRRVMCVLAVVLCCACGYTMAAAATATTAGQPKTVMASGGSVQEWSDFLGTAACNSTLSKSEKTAGGVSCANWTSHGFVKGVSERSSGSNSNSQVKGDAQEKKLEEQKDPQELQNAASSLHVGKQEGKLGNQSQGAEVDARGSQSTVSDPAPTFSGIPAVSGAQDGGHTHVEEEREPEPTESSKISHNVEVPQGDQVKPSNTADNTTAGNSNPNQPSPEAAGATAASDSQETISTTPSSPENNVSDAPTTTPSTVPVPNPEIITIASALQNKANVDSSISPVWMRTAAPLLIVVVLFSATVY
ncbi:uncharacterized protein TM35_000501260 [Trypanosoma theileri]|uniref:Mucin TcMUCII n=1 Tax=Trypanosoma theileri TaxID=67003 RepID=A0A1X0NH37_9TRYP|nr:uncharacterized protein TM35_000501260 [Trypanosoma theileri]ORC84072.1 hypothetical protein TM35_000501260 [Trypanosoma theileri]